jgi:hypothetical protein
VALSIAAIIVSATCGGSLRDSILWLIASTLIGFILANGMGRLRLREVEYVYLNVIVAYGVQKKIDSAPVKA